MDKETEGQEKMLEMLERPHGRQFAALILLLFALFDMNARRARSL